jgi:hypothetical protein
MAWTGMAQMGMVRQAGQGSFWSGRDWRGMAGLAGCGPIRCGKAGEAGFGGYGAVRIGRRGGAWRGTVG